MSPNYLNHTATAEHRHGIESARRHVLNWLFGVFPDHRFDIEDAVAYGDRILIR
jgi:predicted ester cyclase